MPQSLPNLPDFIPDQAPQAPNLPDFIPDGGASFQQRAQPTQGPLAQGGQWQQMPEQPAPGGYNQMDPMLRGYEWLSQKVLDPMAQAGADMGRGFAQANPYGYSRSGDMNWQKPTPESPRQQGIEGAVGGLVGSQLTDPRQLAIMAAMGGMNVPMRAAAEMGFGAQMGYGANEQAGELGKNWDNLNEEQRWEMGTSAALQTGLAGLSGAGVHDTVMGGLRPHLTENLPDFIPDQVDPGTHSGVQEPRLNVRQQAPSTATPSKPAGGQQGPSQMPNTGVEGGPSASMASSQMGGASVGQPKAPGVRGEDTLPTHMTEGLVSPQNLPEFIPDAQVPGVQAPQGPATAGPQQAPVQTPQGRKGPVVDNKAPIAANVPLTASKPSVDEVAANPPSFSEGSTPEVFRPRKKGPTQESTIPPPEVQKTKTPPRSVEEVVKGISPTSRPKRLPDEELANLVNLGEKGAQQAGLSRDDYLAARAEHRRRTAGQAPAAPETPKEPGQDVHQSITRIAKASDETDRARRQNEFLETIRGVPEEHKAGLSESLKKRSEDVGRQASELERINSAKDFAKEVSAARHASELVATGGPETELDSEGQPIKQKFQRQFPIGEEERQYLGYLAGNKQERFKFLRDDSGKAIRTGELEPERQKFADELRDRLEKHRAEVLAQPGGRPTEAQKAEGIRLVTGLQAATGRRQLYSGKGQEGLDPDRAYWNRLMGRPETSHFSKPDEATLTRRLKQLRDEAELSKLASEHLRGERRKDGQDYKGPERRKSWTEIDKENRGPSEGEKLGREIKAARAEKPSGLSEGEVRQRIMRDPVKYEEFRKADRKTQDAMLVKASREEPKEVPKAPEPEKPVDTTKARASEDLEQAYQHLVNLHRKGQGSTDAAKRVRAAIAELKPHAPDVRVPAELEASEVLRAAERPKDRVIDRESTTKETPKTGLSDALWEKLRTSEEIPGALRGAIGKLHAEETSLVAKEDRDNLAYVIPDGLKDMEVARRYGGALKIAGDDLKAGKGLDRAENFARTGSQRTSPKKGEEGFFSLRGKPVDARVEAARRAEKEEKPHRFEEALETVGKLSRSIAKWYKREGGEQKLSDALKGREPQEAFKKVLGSYLKERQKGEFALNEYIKEGKKAHPDEALRGAISKYIQAGGDLDKLREWSENSKRPTKKAMYDNATKLTDAERATADRIKAEQDELLETAQQMGFLKHGVADYMTRLYERTPELLKGLMSNLQAGKLNSSFRYARKRIYETSFDAEQADKRTIDDYLHQTVAYRESLWNAAISRKFWGEMWEGTLKNGQPMLVPEGKWARVLKNDKRTNYAIPLHGKGVGILMDKKLADALGTPYDAKTLTESDKVRTDTHGYKRIDHPSAREWVFSLKAKDGSTVFVQADALAHPDVAEHLENLYAKSWFRQNKVAKAYLTGQAYAKQVLLGFPGFHYQQEGLHSAFHKVNPFKQDVWTGKALKDAMTDPVVGELMDNGLMLYDESALAKFGEGFRGLEKVPMAGPFIKGMADHLFKTAIPGWKATMAKRAFAENLERYGKKLESGQLSRQQMAEITAAQANAAFGELNYEWMGRSRTAQDLFRIVALAPDFLEARARFAGQSIRPYGMEQFKALALRAVFYQWMIARAGNMVSSYMTTGKADSHWDDPDLAFKIKVGDKAYGMRSMASDLMHLYKDWPGFFMYRTSIPLRLAIAAGASYRKGLKYKAEDLLKDTSPIPAQGFIEDHIRKGATDKKGWDKLTEGLTGVQASKYYTPEMKKILERREEERQRRMRGEKVPFRRPNSGLISPGRSPGLPKL